MITEYEVATSKDFGPNSFLVDLSLRTMNVSVMVDPPRTPYVLRVHASSFQYFVYEVIA